MRPLLLLVLAVLAAGCVASAPPAFRGVPEPALDPFALVGSAGALSEADVDRLLGAAVEVRADGRFAVLQVPSAGASPYASWRVGSETALRAREATVETLQRRLREGGAAEVEALPALLVPAEASVPALREIAVRLQADALLVFRTSGDLYERYRLFRSNEFKAYATCEALLLDVRTGAIPFTTVVTTDVLTERRDEDFTDADAARRAVEEATLQAVDRMGAQVMTFLRRTD
jgi:hypothetical protein